LDKSLHHTYGMPKFYQSLSLPLFCQTSCRYAAFVGLRHRFAGFNMKPLEKRKKACHIGVAPHVAEYRFFPAGVPVRTQEGSMADYDRNAYAPYATGMGRSMSAAQYDQGLRSYMLGIYNHMSIALAISGLVAIGAFMLGTTTNPAGAAGRAFGQLLTPFGAAIWASPLKWVIMLAPLAFVFLLSFRWERMSYTALLGTFYAFAAVMGLSLSSVFIIYKLGSIGQVFFITAASFGAMSLFGYTTKKDLSGMGKFMMMGLFGLIIAGLVNIFMKSSALQFAINVIGVLVFAGLTAWDTQRLKEEYDVVAGDETLMQKWSLMGALTLYLNFINMFQMLLQLMGVRNQE
jgi:FtsH-binding integral membrane protein